MASLSSPSSTAVLYNLYATIARTRPRDSSASCGIGAGVHEISEVKLSATRSRCQLSGVITVAVSVTLTTLERRFGVRWNSRIRGVQQLVLNKDPKYERLGSRLERLGYHVYKESLNLSDMAT